MAVARGLVATDAGMQVLWHRKPFTHVVDYDTWEEELLDDAGIVRHIETGSVVPLSTGMDGAWEFIVRWGEDPALTEAEEQHVAVKSEPYLLISETDVRVSGIEHITGNAEEDEGFAVSLPPGRWSVTTHLIDAEALGEALDFVVLIKPDRGEQHRTDVQPFDRPQ
ncbi:hypothetical protein SK854_12555 [Lentzea sp. BCCO 10_0061]|uniref:Uncharacterized protein n=1 Tax=Lentzea sokolovensis TaxID=3095429 RepID=A0ABU4UUJ8_9PSEU|nr:hypothetical protein [Lentzea sp. BCCO 10_0061]MDX8142950.1 hypothetical protein [Lentzea sp. BCCO 10_0061]